MPGYFDYDPSASQGEKFDSLLAAALERSFRSSGKGSFFASYQTILSQVDRYGQNHAIPNTEKAGITFITRPHLNLTTTSCRQHPVLSALASNDPVSIPFSIRCYLDTEFARTGPTADLAADSPFVNNDTPFIFPLTNTLLGISGFPDPVLDTETTEGGFFSEDQTFVKGYDQLNRSYDLTLTFKDIQGGYVMAMLYSWILWTGLATRGIVTAYPDDIDERILSYTCSIYRFVLDPSLRFIRKWAKATGCFPKSVPLGNSFNHAEREAFISSNVQFSVPFQVNHIEYMSPAVFHDFNVVTEEFAGGEYWERAEARSFAEIEATLLTDDPIADSLPSHIFAPNLPEFNYMGIPWIDTQTGLNELRWIVDRRALQDPFLENYKRLTEEINARRRELVPDDDFIESGR